MEKLLKELQEMSALKDRASLDKAKEISLKYTSDKDKAFIKMYMESEFSGIEKDVQALSNRLDNVSATKKSAHP